VDLRYEYGERLFLADDAVVEVFGRLVDGSKRYPLAWVGVSLEERKGDQVRVRVGVTNDGKPFYTDDVNSSGPLSQVDLPASELPALQAFFDELARRSGRA
jgi:hypothetical protein